MANVVPQVGTPELKQNHVHIDHVHIFAPVHLQLVVLAAVLTTAG